MISRAALAATTVLAAALLGGCGSSSDDNSAADSSGSGATTCKYPSDSSASSDKKVDAPPAKPAVTGTTKATMKTSAGDIDLTLDASKAPCTVNSFVSLAKQGYFDATSCHRLTTSGIYVLQCGDPTGTGTGGPGYSFADELAGAEALATDQAATKQYQDAGQNTIVKNYAAGTLAMANAGPDTNGSQFFLVYADSPLPADYAVFGTIGTSGLDVLNTVAKAGTDTGQSDGKPKTAVDITSVSVG
jgi:peptidyl-prolyl cis-trans isomerase B (cyclophilin B)